MKESRFFYVPEALNQDFLPDEETHHALKVLRLKASDEMFLMDGNGSFHRAEVVSTQSKHCQYQIKESMPQDKAWHGRICLGIAPTKMMERMEWLAEKATEIGFDELSFLNCAFSERKVVRCERIEKIVIGAIKQSRKAWKPVVNEICSFKDFISQPRNGKKFIAHCYNEIERKDLFSILTGKQIADSDEITVLVGPEGDFSIDEVRLAMSKGYESISLGESRLRTETAGLAAVMMMQLNARKI